MPSAWPSRRRPGFCSTIRVGDLGERRELRRQRQTRGPAADDQDVEDFRQRVGGVIARRRLMDLGIAGPEAVEIKLHGVSPTPSVDLIIRDPF